MLLLRLAMVDDEQCGRTTNDCFVSGVNTGFGVEGGGQVTGTDTGRITAATAAASEGGGEVVVVRDFFVRLDIVDAPDDEFLFV
jgi:hypothetical protein